MSQTANTAIAVIGIDIGKNSFHVVGHDARDAIDVVRAGTKERPLARTKELTVTYQPVSSRSLREDETRWRFGLPGACEPW
jgi:hypothetical protein